MTDCTPFGKLGLISVMQAIAQSRARECVFDTSRLVDFGERMQLNVPAEQLTPLVREGGRMLITDRHLYFQPLHDIAGGQGDTELPSSGIVSAVGAAVQPCRVTIGCRALQLWHSSRFCFFSAS